MILKEKHLKGNENYDFFHLNELFPVLIFIILALWKNRRMAFHFFSLP
jgi:hypothetical protein